MAIEIDVVLDTNILLRTAFDKPSQPTIESRAFIELSRRGFSIGTTVANLAEFASVATRPAASNGLGLTVAEAQRRIKVFEDHLAIYSESLESYDLWKQLLTLYNVQGKSVHDARIVAIMLHSQIPAVLTLNTSDFKRFPEIVTLHPDELLRTA
jgi:predicted nucleic acid-binding protein